MKSDNYLMIFYGLILLGAIIYFLRGEKVDVEHFFKDETELRLTFNPEQKWKTPLQVGTTISQDSEAFQKLYNWLVSYDGKWYKDDDIASNSLVLIHGKDIRIDIFRYNFYLSGYNSKGNYRSYCGRHEQGELLFLLDLVPEGEF